MSYMFWAAELRAAFFDAVSGLEVRRDMIIPVPAHIRRLPPMDDVTFRNRPCLVDGDDLASLRSRPDTKDIADDFAQDFAIGIILRRLYELP